MLNFLKKKPIIIYFIGIVFLLISLFFPMIEKEVFWVKNSQTLINIDGKWIMLLLLLTSIFTIYKKEKYALIPLIGALLLFIKDITTILPTFKANQILQSFSYKPGFYLFITGLLCLIAYYTNQLFKKIKHHKQESK